MLGVVSSIMSMTVSWSLERSEYVLEPKEPARYGMRDDALRRPRVFHRKSLNKNI